MASRTRSRSPRMLSTEDTLGQASSSGSKDQDGLTGVIRMFNADKGWGFIDGDTSGKDIFLHAKHIVGVTPNFWIGHKVPTKDRDRAPLTPSVPVRVLFDMDVTAQGKPQALNVRLINPEVLMRDSVSDVEQDLRPSPTCDVCGSTIATALGVEVCRVCVYHSRLGLVSQPQCFPPACVPCFGMEPPTPAFMSMFPVATFPDPSMAASWLQGPPQWPLQSPCGLMVW